MTFDSHAADHVMKFPRPSPSVFAYCKRSKNGGVEGLATRLTCSSFNLTHMSCDNCVSKEWLAKGATLLLGHIIITSRT